MALVFRILLLSAVLVLGNNLNTFAQITTPRTTTPTPSTTIPNTTTPNVTTPSITTPRTTTPSITAPSTTTTTPTTPATPTIVSPTQTPLPIQTPTGILPNPTTTRELGTQTASDYKIRLVSQPAKGWYEPRSGQLIWVPAETTANAHLEVFLTNAIDQKPLPNAGVTLSIYDLNNRLVATKPMIMLWAPDGYHYGNNFTIPTTGNYIVRVDITPPIFARHNKQLGNRFFCNARVNFQNVALRPEGRLAE